MDVVEEVGCSGGQWYERKVINLFMLFMKKHIVSEGR